MKDRRETLKIVGAIGSTCAFPFAANELYAAPPQQVGAAPSPAAAAFTPEEFAVISRLADLVIPTTSTPGALAAGVPAYIDSVAARNPAAQSTLRAGLRSFSLACRARHNKDFLELSEADQIAELTPLCEAADEEPEPPAGSRRRGSSARTRQPAVNMFKAVKSLTADGYYTSKIGLIDELGYHGNMVHAEFPVCTHEH